MRKCTLLLFALVMMVSLAACSEPPAPAPAPPAVVVAEPVQRDVPVMTELVGQALGSQDVEIRARVEGFLDNVAFTEGTLVKKGQLLYRIDPKPFEATLANQKANLATWQARYDKTGNDVKRLAPLAKQQAVSQMELDDAVSAHDAAKAQVDAQQAAVDKAALDLGYNGTWKPVDVTLILADGTVHPHTGRLDTVERNIDATTGTLAMQLTFPNPERLLRPGQYGRVRYESDVRKGALLVPQRAVQELQNLYSLAVVGADNKVTFRNVKVGPRVDTLWVIEDGLKPGEKVVVEGLQRVREGAVVAAKFASDVKPASEVK